MTIEHCIITLVDWAEAREDLCRIRAEVFMQEQQVSAVDEWDGLDEQAVHFLGRTTIGNPIATARILRETAAGKVRYHIGRVAVLRNYRGQGIGRQLMKNLIVWCHTQNAAAQIYLHAQTNRRNFYERLGFYAQGEEFMDAGIPHVCMIYGKEPIYEYPLHSQ